MMMMIVTIADLIIFAGYSQFDVILLFGVCWVEVPDICSLAVFRVNDNAATVVSPCEGHQVLHTIPQNTRELVPALLQPWLHLRNTPAGNHFKFRLKYFPSIT